MDSTENRTSYKPTWYQVSHNMQKKPTCKESVNLPIPHFVPDIHIA